MRLNGKLRISFSLACLTPVFTSAKTCPIASVSQGSFESHLPILPSALPSSLPASFIAMASYEIVLPLILSSQSCQAWSFSDQPDHVSRKPSSGSPTLQGAKIKTPSQSIWGFPPSVLATSHSPAARGIVSATLISIPSSPSSSPGVTQSSFNSTQRLPVHQSLLWPSLWGVQSTHCIRW